MKIILKLLIFVIDYYWTDASFPGTVPPNAVDGGVDVGGYRIFVGRAQHAGDWLVAKVVPAHQSAFVSYKGVEYCKTRFKFLCGTGFQWQNDSGGRVPPRAVEGGLTSAGETLYVGRVYHNGTAAIGKIHPSHGVIYYPFAGMEHHNTKYEVLLAPQ